MNTEWNNTEPIYQQLRKKILTMVLDNTLRDGDALPSVRQVAADYQINPLTVLKAYQLLVDEGLVEKRRGLGMFVREGSSKKLTQDQRRQFLDKEWPQIVDRIHRLQLDPDELLGSIKKKGNS